MNRLDITKPLHADAVYFTDDRPPIRNCYIFIAGDFVIIADDMNDARPTWHNAKYIKCLEGVEIKTAAARIG